MALKLSILIEIEKGAQKIQILEDLLLFVNLMSRINNLGNFTLRQIFEEVQLACSVFSNIYFHRVCRETNMDFDGVSKERFILDVGFWHIQESVANYTYESPLTTPTPIFTSSNVG